MKTRTILVPIAAIALGAITSCKTNEANYKAAYEIAKEKQTAPATTDEGIDIKPIGSDASTRQVIVDGQEVPMRQFPVACMKADGMTRDAVKKYNVVVGQFHQIFNANAMRKRLADGGYPGAFILSDSQPMYYVVAFTTDNIDDAVGAMHRVASDKSMVLKTPLPYLLRPTYISEK